MEQIKRLIFNIYYLLFNRNIRKLINNSSGFTLIELIIYVGLLMIMIVIFAEVFVNIIDNQISSRDTSSVADDGRFIYSRFIYDMDQAQAVNEPAPYGSTSGKLRLNIGGQIYTYIATGSSLFVIEPGGNAFQLNGSGSKISSINFTNIGSSSAKNTIQMNFTINGAVVRGGVIDQENFQTTAGLR